jgi:hypothetical protein
MEPDRKVHWRNRERRRRSFLHGCIIIVSGHQPTTTALDPREEAEDSDTAVPRRRAAVEEDRAEGIGLMLKTMGWWKR